MSPSHQQPQLTTEHPWRFTQSPETIAAQEHLRTARSKARRIRAHVDSYTAPIFARFRFTDARTGEALTSPHELYRSHEEATIAEYYAACDEANRANGYDVPAGFCPALLAEHALIKAENQLLKLASQVFALDLLTCHGDLRRQAVELFLNSPRA